MKNAPRQSESVTAFFSENAGVYQYRSMYRKLAFWFAIIMLFGLPIGVYSFFTDPSMSSYETAKAYVAMFFGPYATWTCFVVARRFQELIIDHEGVKILPFGLNIAIQDIEDIQHSQNYTGAGTIKFKLKAPYFVFHLIAWSWAHTLTIAFNKRLLMPVSTTS